ncbi:CRISPR-associated endonuclease Cas3'', partial [Escherichia coli]
MEPFKYICHYWGKSSKSLTKGNDIHLLIYHCLDVAAVADCWWDQSVVLQNTFFRNEMLSKQRVKAWLLFFIALHDIGKFDIRFQYKSAESWLKLNPATPSLNGPSTQMCRKFNHGAAGLYWFKEGANKQVISSQADSLIKISRIWADFFPANTSNRPI